MHSTTHKITHATMSLIRSKRSSKPSVSKLIDETDALTVERETETLVDYVPWKIVNLRVGLRWARQSSGFSPSWPFAKVVSSDHPYWFHVFIAIHASLMQTTKYMAPTTHQRGLHGVRRTRPVDDPCSIISCLVVHFWPSPTA